MTDYKILQKTPTPRYIGNYFVTPSAPSALSQLKDILQKEGGVPPWITINIGIRIFPNSIPYQIRDLVFNGLMDKNDAIKFLERLIDYAEEVLKELKE
jgi:hypothetical protein